ncbi:hypothetical protein GW17_00051247, partial [Ensete ventricosum]
VTLGFPMVLLESFEVLPELPALPLGFFKLILQSLNHNLQVNDPLLSCHVSHMTKPFL